MSTGNSRANRRSAVEKVLEQDDVIAKRVDALKDAHSRLEAAFEAILAGEEADAAATVPASVPACSSPGRRSARVSLASCRPRRGVPHAACRLWLASRHSRISRQSSGVADPDYVGSIPPTWQEDAARAHALLESRECRSRARESRQSRPDRLPARASHRPESHGARPLRRKDCVSCGRSSCAPATSLWRSCLYLGASGAPLALYAKKSEETAAAVVQALRRAWRRGVVASRHRLSPRRRGRRGVADEARRGDQGRDDRARRRLCRIARRCRQHRNPNRSPSAPIRAEGV